MKPSRAPRGAVVMVAAAQPGLATAEAFAENAAAIAMNDYPAGSTTTDPFHRRPRARSPSLRFAAAR
jgi:hypothetical protein